MKASKFKLMRGAALLILVLGMASMGAAESSEEVHFDNADNEVTNIEYDVDISESGYFKEVNVRGWFGSDDGTISFELRDSSNNVIISDSIFESGNGPYKFVFDREDYDRILLEGETVTLEFEGDRSFWKDECQSFSGNAFSIDSCTDVQGRSDSPSLVYIYDINEPPEFQDVSTSPDPPVIDTSSDVSFEASDDNEVSEVEVEWFRDGTLQESQTNTYSSASVQDTITDFYTPTEQGEHTIYFTATDDEGESTTETLEYTEIEESPIAWIDPSDGDTFTYQTPDDEATVNFEWEVDWDDEFTDGETRIQRLDDQDNFENLYTESQSLTGRETFNTDIGLEEGTHEVRIHMEQNDGADTTVTDTRTITVEEETQEPEITLENPEDQAEINYPVEENNADVSFEWVVEAFEEEGTTRLYLDDDEVFTDEFTATFASNPFENVESLSEGSYEWYVEAETEDHLVTSDTRTFTVSEQEIFVDFSLNSPEDNEIITFPFGDEASIDYDGAVSSNIEGEISLLRDSNVLATETHPGDASVSITAEEDLGEGLYDWNLEFVYETIEEAVFDDFEDEDVSDYEEAHSGDIDQLSITGESIEGDYSAEYVNPDDETGSSMIARNTDSDLKRVELKFRPDITDADQEFDRVGFGLYDGVPTSSGSAGSDSPGVVSFADTGTIYWGDYLDDENNIGSWDTTKDVVSVAIEYDFEEETANVIYDGNDLGSFDFVESISAVDTFALNNMNQEVDTEKVLVFDNVLLEEKAEEQEVSDTFSFEVEEEDATPPEINLISPDEGEVFNLDPGQTNEDIDFDWSVGAFEEEGTTRLYVNNDEVFTDDFTATFASNSFSHSENLEVGTNEYYVEAETDSHTVTSDTRTFELNERSMDIPEFTLTRPEDGERLNAGGDSSSEVDFEFAVSAETDGEIGLEVLKPGESDYVNVYNDTYSTGVSQSYNPNVTLENITYPNEVSGINESDSYDWRLTFDSTETDDSFTSDSQSFTFTTEEITTAQSIVDRVLNFFRGYWEALIDGTSTTGKAFMGLVLMLVAGAIGFAAAGSIGAGFGMAAMFLVNTLVGLFPGWIVLALVIGALAYILLLRGD